MDHSDVSLFKADGVSINNPQSKEEDEEIEEQKRLQEELEDLLTDGIHPFRYDDSTMNSSTNTSAVSFDGGSDYNQRNHQIANNNQQAVDVIKNLENDYRNADTNNNQLKILYDIRMREIDNLKDEFQQYQTEKSDEIKILKNKVTLSEAEMRHLQLTVTNLENLLVDKTDTIKHLSQQVLGKDDRIENLEKTIEKLNIEICTYSTTVNELQLKLLDNNPFNAGIKAANSEELHKAHEQQINRLEGLLEEQSKKAEILEKENTRLDEELKRFVIERKQIDDENKSTIMELSKKLTNTQQQCKDLYILGEAIKKESDHFKERLKELEENKDVLPENDSTLPQVDCDTLKTHVERLKRMLLDKDIELKTLMAKQKFYENDMNELFEYRELMDNLQNSSIKNCDVLEHGKQLVIMQKQLNEYQQVLDERNQEIMNLHTINKEYSEKIEEMLKQTRNDIQNLSTRYSLPQLEQMNNDLKLAEGTISNLRDELNQMTINENQLKSELKQTNEIVEKLQQQSAKDCKNFDDNLAKIQINLKQREVQVELLQKQLEDLKKSETTLRDENGRLQKQLDGSLNDLKKSRDELVTCQSFLQAVEETKAILERQLLQTQQQLDDVKLECLQLKKNCDEIHNESITKSIVEELENVENQINKNDKIQIDIIKQDVFQKLLQAELLKSELSLRQQLQNDNLKKLEDIEDRYNTLLQQKSDLFKQEVEKLKKQEDAYRQQLALVLSQCSGKVMELEKENNNLREQLKKIANEYQMYECRVVEQIENYKRMLDQWKSGVAVVNKNWEKTVAQRATKYKDMEKKCNKVLANMTRKLEIHQNEVSPPKSTTVSSLSLSDLVASLLT